LDFLTVPFRFQRRITFANLLYCSNCFYPVSMPERLFKLWNSNSAGFFLKITLAMKIRWTLSFWSEE